MMEIWFGIMLLVMFGLIALMLFVVAGPRNIPKEGIDYFKIDNGDGSVLYNHLGTIVPFEPKARPFLERLVDMDGLFGGWDSNGRGADG